MYLNILIGENKTLILLPPKNRKKYDKMVISMVD